MTLGDQIYHQTKNNHQEIAMKAKTFLSKTILNVTPKMHKTRRLSLFAAVESAVNGGSLSVTGLGRNIDNEAKEKHRIKRVDRLCNNTNLHGEINTIYHQMSASLISANSSPTILVDWSDLDTRKENFLLRASLATQGRSLTLYEEVHPLSRKEKPKVHKQFMETLKAMLPTTCTPIVVTDAGFRIPWFQLIEALGWDYIGRVRNSTHCKRKSGDTWFPIKNLYEKATRKSKDLGVYQQGIKQLFESRLIVVKRKPKGRKDKTATGEKARMSKLSRACAARESEPWLLATSLKGSKDVAKEVRRLYATRMQIEESFRDVKTGLNMNAGDSRKTKRLSVLLLIGLLAQYLLFLLGLAVKEAGEHRQYQANSVKNKNVLSNQYIGLRAYKDKRLKLLKKHWVGAMDKLKQLIAEPQACC